VTLTGDASAVAGVDVGGTRIKSGVLRDGRLLGTTERPTPRDPDEIVAAIADAVAALADHHPQAVGVVVPGVVDTARGVAVWSENLGWRDVPFRDAVAARTGLPVAFGHDVRAGALAEARLGAGTGRRDVVFLPLGTGIAAGLVLDGVLLDRDRPTGEIGHVDVGHGEPCVCGRTGCLEAIAPAAANARRYAARSGRAATAAEIAGLVVAGDADAAVVWQEAIDALTFALAWLAGVVAPEVVVVGGGLARAGDLLLAPLRTGLKARLTFQYEPELVPAALGDLAGCVGAGLLAIDLIGAVS
jgi:glucokinase